jgi:uncharacterized membrane protein
MWLLTALIGAAAWGSADVAGGLAARRTPALSVLVLSTPIGLIPVLLAVLWDGVGSGSSLPWAVAAGAAGGLGLAGLYTALANGPMNVVAPVSAVTGALVPVVAGLLAGERPSAAATLGIVLALGAVVLVSREGGAAGRTDTAIGGRRAGVLLALAAGLGIGGSLALLELAAGPSAALGALLPARLATWACVLLVALAARAPLGAGSRTAHLALPAGLLDGTAYVCYLLALRGGLLSVVGVIVSLYPAWTVLLASFILGERTSRDQNIGLGLACAGVVLMVFA